MAAKLSEAVVRRLPIYYRYLCEMQENGIHQISSRNLGERIGFTASQVRQDISAMGGTGVQGAGYSVERLREHLEQLMGLNVSHNMIIIGGGNLGRAIAHSESFKKLNFNTIAIFDSNPEKQGIQIENLFVKPSSELEGFLSENPVEIAVLALPKETAQSVVDFLLTCGIKAFWNFAPLYLTVPKGVSVVNMHLDEGLEVLSYRILHSND